MKIYIVTDVERGWDCLVGVFQAGYVAYDELTKRFPGRQYHIFERYVEDNLKDYE